jgi:hypothetical protein
MPLAFGPSEQRTLCEAWLQADDHLSLLTLKWSEVESQCFAVQPNARSLRQRALLKTLEQQISRLDQQRSSLLRRILQSHVVSDQEAVYLLLVAARLLEGEGGDEYRLVTAAVRQFGRSLWQQG